VVKSPFAALNWGVHANDSALYLVTAAGGSSNSSEGLNTWDVITPTAYKTFGEAVNRFARSIYQGWIWRLENVAEYSDLSEEEFAELTYFWDWVYYGNDMSDNQAFKMDYFLNVALRDVLNEVFKKEVFETENFYQNGSLISTNSRLPVIPVETQQELTDLEPKIEFYVEQSGRGEWGKEGKSVLLISLLLTYYDGYETDEKCEFRLYRIGGSQ
jgi:hypothetical protein